MDVAFVLPDHETQPPIFQPAYCGKGAMYTIEVDDVDEECSRLEKSGIKVALALRNEPWGERHFAVIDPNGIPVNISQMIEPAKEYLPYFK